MLSYFGILKDKKISLKIETFINMFYYLDLYYLNFI
jgi:hypothetical protein